MIHFLRSRIVVLIRSLSLCHQLACNAYHLPGNVAPHVDLVTPSIHFNAIISKRGPSPGSTQPARTIGQPGAGMSPKFGGKVGTLLTELENCDTQITPICLRALYKFAYVPLSASKNSFGIGQSSEVLPLKVTS